MGSLFVSTECIHIRRRQTCMHKYPQNMSLLSQDKKKSILGWMNKVASANRSRRESIFKENVCLQRASISQHPPATPGQICVLCFVYANHFWKRSNFFLGAVVHTNTYILEISFYFSWLMVRWLHTCMCDKLPCN